ncbi:MAG: IS1182 family transposase, partial [Chitinivibrionales bacterium]|nr:IS1182 family transposase [Chitinivibrionales bacterium]
MARYKDYSYEQTKMVAISYDRQVLPGTFEHTLSDVINSLDMSIFDDRYRNDETGAPAYDPRILLKIILFAYSKGIIYSRRIAQLCNENVVFMALSADSRPHFTTIANFVSSMQEEIIAIFRHVLQICMELDLIDGCMFAIDGVKLPSNASKEWSGTKEDLRKKKEKLEAALDCMVRQHRNRDTEDIDNISDDEEFKKRLDRARKKVEKLDNWLENNEDKVSSRRRTKQSNVTDNESAKMKTSHGVIQGYNGMAVVDSKHQVIVNAEAFGQGHDTNLLKPAIEGTKEAFEGIGVSDNCFEGAVVTADTGFHSTDNLEYLEAEGIDGYVPDSNFRKRDPRFSTAPRHKEKNTWGAQTYTKEDFAYISEGDYFICPEGHKLTKSNSDLSTNGITYYKYNAKQRICGSCSARMKCIDHKHRRPRSLFRRSDGCNVFTERMRNKIDTEYGRKIYSKRMSVVEPVFGNIRWAKGMHRFTLRTKRKVNVQWLFYCLIH